jgi:hypothetical protein
MRTAHVALLFGAVLGIALVIEGFGEMLVVALVAAIAWTVGRVMEGDLDLSELASRANRNARRSPGA